MTNITYEAFLEGKKIGQRKSARPYTHALVLSGFLPEVARKLGHYRSDLSITQSVLETCKRYRAYLALGLGGTYSWPGAGRPLNTVIGERELAEATKYLDGTDQQVVERAIATANRYRDESIANRVAQGDTVLSWHMGAANAAKAHNAARNLHREFTRIVMVEAIAKPAKLSAADTLLPARVRQRAWVVKRGTSSARIVAADHASAVERAAAIGFAHYDSLVLDTRGAA